MVPLSFSIHFGNTYRPVFAKNFQKCFINIFGKYALQIIKLFLILFYPTWAMFKPNSTCVPKLHTIQISCFQVNSSFLGKQQADGQTHSRSLKLVLKVKSRRDFIIASLVCIWWKYSFPQTVRHCPSQIYILHMHLQVRFSN